MRLLLINPRFPESFWSFQWAMHSVLPSRRAVNAPLGLATLAALCPADWEVTIVDENIETLPLQPAADLIGVCGMGVQFPRQRELLTFYRSRGYFVVAGGSYASLCPESFVDVADSVVSGEAEYIWPEFCRDFARGAPMALYRETGTVSLTDSPVPRFDLLKVDRYQSMSVQFSRGCPFQCEFCDIIVMFGRKPRSKSVEQIGRELDLLRRLGAQSVFFVDDNLIGNKRTAKELLRYLEAYQREHAYRFHFGTEASLNLAHDKELLELFARAGMDWVFIGIESPDEASLKEAQKFQNTRQDILGSLRTVYAHGIDILAGFIVGFDHDTVETFDRQRDFILQSGIQASMIGLLTAAPKTPLYARLDAEGRILAGANNADNTKLATNVMPKRMSYDELIAGYRRLHQELFADRGIALRIRNKLRHLRTSPRHRYSFKETVSIMRQLVFRGLLPGGPGRVFRFVGSIPVFRPRLIPRVVEDWIIGLSMRDYVDRHFRPAAKRLGGTVPQFLPALERALSRYREAGALEVSLTQVRSRAMELTLRLRGRLDQGFFTRAARHLERALRDSTASVVLRIDALHEAHLPHLERLLDRLARYGDRIRVSVDERLRGVVRIDSSIFHLSLES
ncbi:MAG TPA: radical SAM protein [Gemmatimonadales bacterium]|nr:radical SAM protein [Gemmatimonadales bacterium]